MKGGERESFISVSIRRLSTAAGAILLLCGTAYAQATTPGGAPNWPVLDKISLGVCSGAVADVAKACQDVSTALGSCCSACSDYCEVSSFPPVLGYPADPIFNPPAPRSSDCQNAATDYHNEWVLCSDALSACMLACGSSEVSNLCSDAVADLTNGTPSSCRAHVPPQQAGSDSDSNTSSDSASSYNSQTSEGESPQGQYLNENSPEDYSEADYNFSM